MTQPFLGDDDFYFDEIKHPNDYLGNPAYAPVDLGHPSWQRMTRWEDMGKYGNILRGESPQWVWMHPHTNWKVWHLSGPREGIEGVVLGEGLDGVHDLEFEHRYSKGPYLIGAERERTDYMMGVVDFAVWINPSANINRPAGGPFAMHKIEDSWRQSWSDTVPGFLGCFTRMHGWRFIPAIQGSKIRRDSRKSPTAHGNQSTLLSMTAHMPWPLFAKRALTEVWKPAQEDIIRDGYAKHTFHIPNRGTFESAPKFIVRGTSRDDITIDGKKGFGVRIQDGNEGKMVPIPPLLENDGDYIFVDTDQSRQTLTTEKEPIDGQIYKTLRQSQFLALLLNDKLQSHLPAQRRIPGGIDFDNPIPPRTVAHITVTHTNPSGSVEMILPQYFRASWS
ncbi:minor tail protein [Mycobacterium phage Paito]|uniref:Minor tail protein n=1 Tax=Mycobacterium phage Paito TaxID=2315544 RepID=A0A386KGX8_9CAUD|nr:minor tail protein [Mycobacterium phage Paito]AYD84602.1 minor tail protein [Mycobacterium phage Paito]